jgi:hypothetical protein
MRMDHIGTNAFIVMSGPPQEGKRERISKVRSHITKGYFRRQNENSRLASRRIQVPDVQEKMLVEDLHPTLPPEIPNTVFSMAADCSMSDSAFLKSETTRRMQKCKSSALPVPF